MQYLLEHFGVAVSAITGVLAARGKQLDLFGVIVLALVTAFGGGTIRDVTLGNLPVFWIDDPNYLLTATAVAVFTFFLARFQSIPRQVLLISDAFALALFTIIGVKKALGFSVAPSIAIALGVITGVAGGILRDLLTGVIPLVFRKEIHLYATAAFCGAAVFVMLEHWVPGARWNMVLGVGTTLVMRLAGIRWKLGLPVFDAPDEPPTGMS